MKPLIEIRRIGPEAFAYRVQADGAHIQEGDESEVFYSLAHCLSDVGAVLDHGFASVELSLDGLFMGSCAVDVLRRDPQAVARRIQQHFQPASA